MKQLVLTTVKTLSEAKESARMLRFIIYKPLTNQYHFGTD
jgi:hypothetical protein